MRESNVACSVAIAPFINRKAQGKNAKNAGHMRNQNNSSDLDSEVRFTPTVIAMNAQKSEKAPSNDEMALA